MADEIIVQLEDHSTVVEVTVEGSEPPIVVEVAEVGLVGATGPAGPSGPTGPSGDLGSMQNLTILFQNGLL